MDKRIWDSRMWIRNGIEQCVEKNAAFGLDVTNKSHIGAQLLLFDNVTIPTYDFGIVPVLVNWCGMNGLIHLLEYGAFSFAWMDMMPAYGGGGAGLISYAVDKPNGGWENWRQVARWAAMPESAEAQLHNSIQSSWTKEAKNDLIDLVLKNSFEANTRAIKPISQETIRDVSTIAELNHWIFAAEGMTDGQFGFNNLAGLSGNKIRVVNNDELNDAVDLVLRLAEINAVLMAASSISECDLGLPLGVPRLLTEKMKRCGATTEQLQMFVRLLDLNNMPDIRPAIESGDVSLRDIAEVRTSHDAEQFRKWMRKADANNARELEILYHKATQRLGSKKWPVKLVRIVSTAGIGVVGGLAASTFGPTVATMAGAATSLAADTIGSLFVEKWIDGYNPSLFLDQLRALPIDDPYNPS